MIRLFQNILNQLTLAKQKLHTIEGALIPMAVMAVGTLTYLFMGLFGFITLMYVGLGIVGLSMLLWLYWLTVIVIDAIKHREDEG